MLVYTFIGALVAPLLLLASPSAAADYADYRGDQPPSIPCIMYEVRRGDYCYGIARNNGISYAQFLRQNPGIDCTRLRAGQSICLIPLSYPGGWDGGWDAGDADYDRFGGSRDRTKGLGVASPCKAYTVKEGDLCTLIAEDHKITVDKLVEFNKMLPSWKGCRQLAVGQNICVE